MMRKTPLLKTISFVLAVCAIGFFTSCDASWSSLDMIGKMVGIDLKQASGCGCNCLGTKGTVRLTNDLTVNIAGVFMATVEDEDWGENLLTDLLPPNGTFEQTLSEGLWDIATVDADSNVRYRLGVMVSAGQTLALNVSELTLHTDEDDTLDEDIAFFMDVPKGPPTTVPNVVGMNQANAESSITSAGLVVGSVIKQYSRAVTAGNVISQAPTAGNTVPGGTMIGIAVAVSEQFTDPDLEAELQADDVRWEDLPDLAQETAAIADTLDAFTEALKEGDVDAAVLKIHRDKQEAYKELFNSNPGAMESFADILSGITLSFMGDDSEYIGKQADYATPMRTAEYKVTLDGFTFYVVFGKVDGTWVLLDF